MTLAREINNRQKQIYQKVEFLLFCRCNSVILLIFKFY